jgi:hypothetical protein
MKELFRKVSSVVTILKKLIAMQGTCWVVGVSFVNAPCLLTQALIICNSSGWKSVK